MKLSLIAFASAAGLLAAAMMAPNASPDPVTKANRYIGANKCKNCHSAEEGGAAYKHWEESKHAKAYETLGTDAAKAAAAERGIDNPQEADACLKCHVTAFGLDKKEIKSGFKMEMGVQCETCHGPGEAHMKARMMAAASGDTSPPGPDEMPTRMKADDCKKCHNEESPSYKPFCFKERMQEIRHLDPRKERTEEELKIPCDCEKCKG